MVEILLPVIMDEVRFVPVYLFYGRKRITSNANIQIKKNTSIPDNPVGSKNM